MNNHVTQPNPNNIQENTKQPFQKKGFGRDELRVVSLARE
jgi:hypothetical protein